MTSSHQPALFPVGGGTSHYGTPLPPKPRFDGESYLPFRDDPRLTDQLKRVWAALESRSWLTLREIAGLTGDPEASISAQLRHLRKARFGAHTVDKRYLGDGLFEYRLTENPNAARIMASARAK